ncbi:MAG: hypothetical protein IT364_18145 [Candidatus Hydrogenedentes bacterium]|nr:hypothetical protein [Candidatus Hydrogenedentota bacterium]
MKSPGSMFAVCVLACCSGGCAHFDQPEESIAVQERSSPLPREVHKDLLIDPDELDEIPLKEWTPTEADKYTLDPAVLCCDMAIPGRWYFTDHRFFGTDMIIAPKDGLYSVRFIAWGCVGELYFERTATFANGVVHLDKPVRDFWSNTYQDLYAVKACEREFLVPACVAKDFDEWIRGGGTTLEDLPWHMLQRIAQTE